MAEVCTPTKPCFAVNVESKMALRSPTASFSRSSQIVPALGSSSAPAPCMAYVQALDRAAHGHDGACALTRRPPHPPHIAVQFRNCAKAAP